MKYDVSRFIGTYPQPAAMAVGRDLVDSFDRASPQSVQRILQFVCVGYPIEVRGRRVRSDRQNDQHGDPVAVIARAPPSAEDAVTVFPEYRVAAVRIAFTGRPGQRNVIDGERVAIAHTKWRTNSLCRNRHLADAAIDG